MSEGQTKYRVAVAGCHRMLDRTLAVHNFAAAFNAVSETEVVAVFDYGAETREQFTACWREVWGDVSAYDDYGRMLEEVRPDLLCITTRQTMHADQIEAGVEAGVRGIICDRPLATTLSEMDRIVKACEDTPLLFALDRRWSAPYVYLRENMADLVGEVSGLVTFGLRNTIYHGCHWYDATLALLGDPEPVWVGGLIDHTGSDDELRRMDPPSRAQIGMDNGVVAYVTPDGTGQNFEITGEKGRLSIFAEASAAYLRLEGDDETQAISLPTAGENWPTGPAMVHDLVEAVKSGGQTGCNIDHARRATEIGFAIHSSSAGDGVKVSLPASDRSLRVESFPWGNEKP